MIVEIATAISLIKGAKQAFEVAKEAFDEIKACAEAGKSAHESLGALTGFFSAAGKAEEGIAKAKELQEHPPENMPEDTRSDYEIVIDMMVAERQLRQFYVELREMFIYQFQEPGLYDEFMDRLQKLRDNRRKVEMDKRLHQKALEMQARRARQKKRELIQNIAGTVVVVGIFMAFIWFMAWMFDQKGKL
jgi:type I site-specific restriction-modification system R (restriction) subunit